MLRASQIAGSWCLRTSLRQQVYIQKGKSIQIEFNTQKNEEIDWFQRYNVPVSHSLQHEMNLLQKLANFRAFMKKKYPMEKLMFIEGNDGVILAYDKLLRLAARKNGNIITSWYHRGRIELFATVLQFPLNEIFYRVEGGSRLFVDDQIQVMGFHNQIQFSEGTVNVEVMPCAGHVESGHPVALGFTKSKLIEGEETFCTMIHGDASISGQGVVYETFNLSKLFDYSTRGVIHIVSNNGIGFTTRPEQFKSFPHCTDVSLIFQTPVLHVHNSNMSDLIQSVEMAYAYKQVYNKDVVINVIGQRANGHHELDDPLITHPIEYKTIDRCPSHLLLRNEWSELEKAHSKRHMQNESPHQGQHQQEKGIANLTLNKDVNQLAKIIQNTFDSVTMHPVVQKILRSSWERLEKGLLDWNMSEWLAFIGVLNDGYGVRLAGQDSSRGAFNQRHLKVWDQRTGNPQIPLHQYCSSSFCVVDTPLSEYAALAFEYGFSLNSKKRGLVIWEAQFGDYANNAQTIIDQYIAAGNERWGVNSNLILLLPHGTDGSGADHSSARVERFLQLAAESRNIHNMDIWLPVQPHVYYQILRNQVWSNIPLVIFSPKMLLRDSTTFSPVSTELQDLELIISRARSKKHSKIVLCCGQLYWKIKNYQQDLPFTLVCVQKLFPFPKEKILSLVQNTNEPLIWIQEEPSNQGAWKYIQSLFNLLEVPIRCSAFPAMGPASIASRTDFNKKLSELIHSLFSA